MFDFGQLLTYENGLIGAIAWIMIVLAQKVKPSLFEQPLVARALPFIPIAVTSVLVWIPGLSPPSSVPAAQVVALGVILGYLVGHNDKIWRQSIRGKDKRIVNGDLVDKAGHAKIFPFLPKG